jgi:hypothetical protein
MESSNIIEVGSTNTVTVDAKDSRKKRKVDAKTTAGKAQQKKRTKGKAKAGRLEGLISVPMDVLFEVFYYPLPFRLVAHITGPDIRPLITTRYSPFGAYHEGVSTRPHA